MPIKALLPSDLANEITDLGANDYLVAQKSGESKLSKLKPGAISPADIGAAAAGGSLTQNFAIKELALPSGSTTSPAYIYGPYNAGLGTWDWNITVYNYKFHIMSTSLQVRNQTNSAYAPIDCGAITYDSQSQRSDPRLKRNIRAPIDAPPSAQALAAAVIEYDLKTDGVQARKRLGFNAKTLAEFAPAAAITLEPYSYPNPSDPPAIEEVRAIDMTALTAILVRQMARLEERLALLETRLNALA